MQAQYRFDHWSADDGLPQNSVRDIVQTRDGYLWLTTLDGLVRFDGVRFTVFNKSNSPGIVSNRFVALYEDGQGDLWASTETSGVTRLHQGRFTTYTTAHGLPSNIVGNLGDDGQGRLVCFASAQLFRWADGKFEELDDLQLPREQIAAGLAERADRAAIATDFRTTLRAVVWGQLQGWEWAKFPPDFRPASSAVASDGTLWIGSEKYGLFGFEKGKLTRRITQAEGLPGNNVYLIYGRQPLQAISVDARGSFWLFDLKTRKSELMTQTPPEKATLCYADREGNYWFTTYNDGLYRARRQSITTINQVQGLNTDEIYPLLEDRLGAIWIGTNLDGLYRLQQGVFTHYEYKTTGLPSFVSSLYEDRAGRIWFNGAWRSEGDSFKQVYDASPTHIWTMYEDHEGAFWRGSERGVERYKDGVKTTLTTQDGLAGNDTKVIIEAVNGGLWLGSYGGLTYYKDGKFTKWTEQDGLPGATVRALQQEADGTLWIGTYDSGLGRFKDGKFTRYTMKDGLFDNGVFQFLADDQGWCWMSCNRGIYRVRKQELNDFADGKIKRLNSLPYGKGDGISNVECNGGRWPAGIKTRDGKLWFPTMDGVAVVDPKSVSLNPQPPPVLIESFLLDREPVAFDGEVTINPGQDNFEIQYTALSFVNSEHLRFRYKLEGLEADWIDVGTRRTANYSHVPPASYTFKVIAANSDGVWNETGQSLRLRVLPPFYRTWWFLTLAVLSLGGLVFATYEYRVRQLRRVQAAQEAFSRQLIASQESERKRIASELHDSLGQSLVLIRNWAMLGASQLEPQAPATEELDEIKSTASRAINEVREIAYNLGPYHLDRLGLAETIREMVNRVAQASGIHFTTTLDPLDGALSREAEMSLYRITQEALNNLVKHAEATKAAVSIQRTAKGVKLTVTDDGKGFDAQAILASTQKAGFGLHGLSERVRLLNGTMAIQSAPGQGTTLEVTL
ncbi:MAG: hypothetical protein JNM09_13125 [Blastocatellia bacterium]|nr:hypothetical protein [Blastocatellia bacterium]